jgi:serine/threonine protein kinase
MTRLGVPSTPPLYHGRYELLAVVGSGSFGVVYRARDVLLDREVAVKRTQAVDLAEARALAAVRHPQVVSIYDVGRGDSGVYLAMEYLDGVGLRAWLASERPSRRRVLGLFAELAEGLAAIHEAGLVHADVKPSNVLVTEKGAVLVDLGLAGAGVPGARPYQAPEVRAGSPPSSKSDQYSFALMLAEAVGPRVLWRVRGLLARATARDPHGRWRDMAELSRALRCRHRPLWALVSRIVRSGRSLAELLSKHLDGSARAPCTPTWIQLDSPTRTSETQA